MRLEYRLLWKISLISVVFGIFCLLGSYCFTAVNDELNRKAEELFSQGIQAERQEKNTDAKTIYEQCLRLAKENNIVRLESPVLHRLAILKAKEQKWTESELYFREAIKRDKENTALLCDFAKLYADQKNYADAETILKNALLITPDHRRTLFNLGHIIALQNDRQTEGLRYLKLAIGDAAAYQELAKIYRQQGNNAQAEFAEQRASILEKSQTPPSADTLTSPTVTMDDQTKKELVQRVKEELLRLETAEIAATPQPITLENSTPQQKSLTTTETEPSLTKLLPTNSPSDEPLLTKPLPTKSPSTEPLQTEPLPTERLQTDLLQKETLPTEPLQTEPLQTEPLRTEPLRTEPIRDPFLVAAELQKVEELKKDQQESESAIESFPVKTNSNIETESPETVKPFQPFPEPSRQQVVKILQPEPLTNEPVKTFSQDVRSDPQTNNIRTLPATDFRISNSIEDNLDIPKQPEVRPLTIVPLEDAAAVKNIPEYTAINVRKIPLTESEKTTIRSRSETQNSAAGMPAMTAATAATTKTEKNEEKNSVSQFWHPVSSDSAATISISLSKNKTPQNTVSDKSNSDFSARLHLEQPINLITFHSTRSQLQQPHAPVPVLNSSEKVLQEIRERPENQKDYPVTKDRPASPQRSTKSILRPGAGKIGIQEGLDSYVYVDPNAPKNNDTPNDNVTSEGSELAEKNKNTATKSVPETNLITKSVTGSFSLMRPIPGKLANQLAYSSRFPQTAHTPSAKTETKTTTEITETIPLPVAETSEPTTSPFDHSVSVTKNESDIERTVQEESEINKKVDVQFSSMQAPTVLKFEIASTTKSENSDQQKILNDLNKSNKIVTQKDVAALAKPVAVQPESVKTDSLQKNLDDTFQPPTVLKFAPVQNEIVSKPNSVQPEPIQPEIVQSKTIQAEPVQSEIVQSKPIQAEPVQPEIVQSKPIQPEPEPEPVLVQKTEPLPTPPEPIIATTPEVSPQPAITQTTVSVIPTTQAIPETPTIPTESIPQTDSVAISTPESVPVATTSAATVPAMTASVTTAPAATVPAMTVPAATVPAATVQESAFPKQQPKLKTEIADNNTLPQPTLAHVDAFLPILTTPQPETFFVQKSVVLPPLEPPQSEANLRFKVANETETKNTAKLSVKPITEQNIDQQLKMTTSSDTLKFVTPNRPQQNLLPNQENTAPKSTDDIVSKTPTIEIVQKPTDETISETPTIEIVQKPTDETISETTTFEIVQKPTDETISETTTFEIVQKPTDETISETTTIEIVQKPTDETISETTTFEIVQKPTDETISETTTTEIVPKPADETISTPTTEIVSKPTIEIITKPEKSNPKPEPVLTLIPLEVESAQRTKLERPPVQARTQTPIERSDKEEVFVLKKIERTQPRLKTEVEITERLALNSISNGTLSDQPEKPNKRNEMKPDKDKELAEETEMIAEDEPVGFASTRKVSSFIVSREVSGTVDDFLKPKENFGKHPIFSLDSSSLKNDPPEKNELQNQETEENVGFARSGKYSKKTQQDSSKNAVK
ncbi:MAG: hypothetical protein LBG58_03735 [Planctomycetaceae bacterium]|jgi:tetratricopeptide (TPR) repeat protein|nr:hypothetical protein [Planctomycetaceae bacterium]